ncbi:anti-repressor SinI family protein [Oceanobacillus salinisoli]|nr:anti-repressor SinI family protein [Oceanobacillus salinisoli]
MSELVKDLTLDSEWVTLIKEAKNLGMTIDEVRTFLKDEKEEA